MDNDPSSSQVNWTERFSTWFFKYIALALLFSLFGALSYGVAGPLLYGVRRVPEGELPESYLIFGITLKTLLTGFAFGLCTAVIVCPFLALRGSTAVPKKWICISLGSMVIFLAILRRFDLNYSQTDLVKYFPAANALLLCVLSAFFAKQRLHARHCAHCDYDLTGNVSGVCPECGTPVPPSTSAINQENKVE